MSPGGHRLGTRLRETLKAEIFLRRLGNQLLDIYQHFRGKDRIGPFLPIRTLHNSFCLRGLSIYLYLPHLEPLLRNLSVSAPELKYLEIQSPYVVGPDMKLKKLSEGE